MNTIKTRNYNLDTLKLLCAFFVVIIHIPIFAEKYLYNIVFCAVPCFLMISGFFIYTPEKEVMKSKLARSIKRILIILLWSVPLYLFFDFIYGNPWNCDNLIFLITYNIPLDSHGFHLWYLFAYLYVLIIVYFAVCWNKLKWLKTAMPILFIGGLYLSLYSIPVVGKVYPEEYSRNYLFTGLPFFALGMYIKEHFQQISSIKHIARYSKYALLISIGLTLAEFITLQKLHWHTEADLFIGTVLIAITLFLTFALSPRNKPNLLSTLGEKDSLYIYILHMSTLYLLSYFIDLDSPLYQSCGAIIIFIITLAGIEATRWIWQKGKKLSIKKRKSNLI